MMIDLKMAKLLNLEKNEKKCRSLCYKKIHKRQNDQKGRFTLVHF